MVGRSRTVVGAVLLAGAGALASLAGCGDDGDVDAFCATARRFSVDNPAEVFDRYDPEDPSTAAGLLREAAVELERWAGDAPDDVDGAIEDIAEHAEALAAAFEDPSGDAVDSLRDGFERVEAASRRVVAFTQERCEVDLEPATTVSVLLATTTTLALEG